MKILQIFGAVVAVHLLAFIFIFASPGCQSGPRNIPTPDATMPTGQSNAPVGFTVPASQPVDLGTAPASYPSSGHAAPTRPGSAAAVAVTPPKPAPEVASVGTYTVVRGDSLWTVAKKHGLTVAELAKLNSMSTGVALRPGQKLFIPGKPGSASADKPKDVAAAPAPAATKPVNGESVTHIVATGESLGTIARKYGVKVGDIASANNLSGPTIRPGQKLIIPGSKAVLVKGSPATPAKSPATKPVEPAAAPANEPLPSVPHFQLAPPPAGQDLDAGLKDTGATVPTLKVEEKTTPPKL